MYGADLMSENDNKNFLKWYNTQKSNSFNLQEELYDYCNSDVDILSKSCLIFRELFISITKSLNNSEGIDPFKECLTLVQR